LCNSLSQGEDGEFEPILHTEELEALYDRILAEELVVKNSGGISGRTPGSASRRGQHGGGSGGGRAPLNARLAAALGLTQLLLPFRCVPFDNIKINT